MPRLSLLPRTDPIGLLVLGRPTRAVDSVWVRGNRIVEAGELRTVDILQLRQQLFEQSQWIGHRELNGIQDFEAHYRTVMQLAEKSA